MQIEALPEGIPLEINAFVVGDVDGDGDITGENPSVHTARSNFVEAGRAPWHPVESIDWFESRA